MFRKIKIEKIELNKECIAKTYTTDNESPEIKIGMTVKQHSLIVTAVAETLYSRLPQNLLSLIPPNFKTIVALHDLGKISLEFQFKTLPEKLLREYHNIFDKINVTKTHHPILSSRSIKSYLEDKNYKKVTNIDRILRIVGQHHGSFTNQCSMNDHVDNSLYEERRKFIMEMEQKFGSLMIESDISEEQETFLSGLLVFSDWVGSSEEWFHSEEIKELDYNNYLNLAEKALDKLFVLDVNKEIVHNLKFDDIFPFTPNQLQSEMIDVIEQAEYKSGIYCIEAEMGLGKTEAALYASYLLNSKGINSGFYFALPTQLTSNMISNRIQKNEDSFMSKVFSKRCKSNLTHGTSWLQDKVIYGSERENEYNVDDWYTKKKSLLYPYGVGTIDQTLMGVIPVFHNFLRLYGLAGRVVIMDEIHSYDGYTGKLIEILIEKLIALGSSVIIISATLTNDVKKKLLNINESKYEYPLITANVGGKVLYNRGKIDSPLKVFELEIYDDKGKDIKRVVEELLPSYSKSEIDYDNYNEPKVILWVENTVKDSQKTFATLKSLGYNVGLLHSKFTKRDRKENEERWSKKLGKDISKRETCILVGTQVVEQSLDLNADLVISRIAPIDYVLQRSGRCFRHVIKNRSGIEVRNFKPRIIILSDYEKNIFRIKGKKEEQSIYDVYIVKRSLRILTKIKRLQLPTHIRRILELLYKENSKNSEYQKMMKEITDKSNKAQITSNYKDYHSDVEGVASTRLIDFETIDICLLREIKKRGSRVNIEFYNGKTYKNVSTTKKKYEGANDFKELSKSVQRNTVSIAKNVFYEIASSKVNNLEEVFKFDSFFVVDSKNRIGNYKYNSNSGFIKEEEMNE